MRVRIWVPFAVAIGALALSLILLFFMPESLDRASPSKHHNQNHDHDQDPLLGPEDHLSNNDNNDTTPTTPNNDQEPQESTPKTPTWHPPLQPILHLLRTPGLPFAYTLFFLKPLAMIAKAYVYQYASINFNWDLSSTTWLRFAQAGGSTIATIMVLPLLSSLIMLRRRGRRGGGVGRSSAQDVDLSVICISLGIGCVGFLILQFSTRVWMLLLGLFICGLGEGEEPALQGLATSLIQPEYHARLFTSVAVVEIVAKLVGGPLMGLLFSIGGKGKDGEDGGGGGGEGKRRSAGVCFSVAAGILGCLMVFAVAKRMRR